MINGAESKFNDYEVRVIGQIIPEIFKKPNFLSDFIKNSSFINIGFNTRKPRFQTLQERERRQCVVSYGNMEINEGQKEFDLKKKWILHATFYKIPKDLRFQATPKLEITFIGDKNADEEDINIKHNPTDRILIYDYDLKRSVLIDFKNKKLGISEKSKKGGMVIYRYENTISFEKFIGNDFITRFEYDKKRKIVAVVLANGQEIILPAGLSYNYSVISGNDKISGNKAGKLLPDHQPSYEKVTISKYITIDGKQFLVSTNKGTTFFETGGLKLTLSDLKFLYFKFKLCKNYKQLEQMGFRVTKQPELITSIIHRNISSISSDDGNDQPIIKIFNAAVELGLMEEKMILKIGKVFVNFSLNTHGNGVAEVGEHDQ